MKDPEEIPVSKDVPLYTQRVTLDGAEYVLKLDWNEREKRWYLSIYDIEENPLALGIKVISNWPLLRQFSRSKLPPGELFALDFAKVEAEPPEYLDLGLRVRLFYLPKG